MFGLGTSELLIILVIVVIIFGVGKLPEIGSGLGRAIRNFKKASDADSDTAAKDSAKLNSSSDKSQS